MITLDDIIGKAYSWYREKLDNKVALWSELTKLEQDKFYDLAELCLVSPEPEDIELKAFYHAIKGQMYDINRDTKIQRL